MGLCLLHISNGNHHFPSGCNSVSLSVNQTIGGITAFFNDSFLKAATFDGMNLLQIILVNSHA
jgi:hypothetical protein